MNNIDKQQPMSVDQLRQTLDERGDMWPRIWLDSPTDGVFDDLYFSGHHRLRHDAFIYEGKLLVREELNGEKAWVIEDEPLEWLLEHPPYKDLTPIATLFMHSRGIEAGASPWLLFQYLIGTAVTSQGMGLNSLMGIGADDATFLGRALEAWGRYEQFADPYIELLLMYGGEEG